MNLATPMFLTTLSVLSRDEGSNSCTTLTDNSSTVSALLVVLHFRNIILRQYPSMQPCITNPQRISL